MSGLPSAMQAEASLMATLLISTPQISGEIFDLISEDDLYHPQSKAIFSAARKVYTAGAEADIALIADEMTRARWQGESPAVILARLLDVQPVATNIQAYAECVKEAAIRRKLSTICQGIVMRCGQTDATAQDVLDQAQTAIMDLSLANTRQDYVRMETLLDEALDRYDRLAQNKGAVTGVSTGYHLLDYLTCGWQKSDLIIIAAAPSMGKSALMSCLVRNHILNGTSVGVFSLEMSRGQIMDRIIAGVTAIHLMKLRSGKFEPGDMDLITRRADQLANERLAVDDTGGISVEEIARKAKSMVMKDGVEIIYIDYLGLIAQSKAARSQAEGIGKITRALKILAKDLDIPVVCLCQLNRKIMERTNKRPMLSDLRDSGSIEQDADVVAFIYRDEVYNQDENNPNRGLAEIIVAKQRNGPTRTIGLQWVANSARFENLQEG